MSTGSGGEVRLDEPVPLRLVLAPAFLGAGLLPVARDRDGLARDPALGEQMTAHGADGARLAVDEGVDRAGGEVERAQRVGEPLLAAAVQPADVQRRPARRAAARPRGRRPAAARGPGGRRGCGRARRRSPARRSGRRPSGASRPRGPARTRRRDPAAGACPRAARRRPTGRPRPSSPWTTKSIVSRPVSASQPATV